jgi:ABC-type multidrug transport system fused ATPase/permease subunit
MTVGTVTSAVLGALQPSFAIIVAEILGNYSKYACGIDGNPNPPKGIMSKSECAETLMTNLKWWSIALITIGIVHLFGYIVACYAFGKSGEIMTMRLRSKLFAKYLSLEMSYFDEPENSTGALTTRLSTDASKVKGATGTKVSLMVQNATSLLAAFIIGFIYEWRLTLLNIGLVPLLIVAGFCQIMLFTGKLADSEQKAFEEAGKNSFQALANIRTVASLNREREFLEKFESLIQIPLASSQKKSILYGFAYGMGQSMGFFVNFISFHFGVWLIQSKRFIKYEINILYINNI